jgi:hypothetical protein
VDARERGHQLRFAEPICVLCVSDDALSAVRSWCNSHAEQDDAGGVTATSASSCPFRLPRMRTGCHSMNYARICG